MRFERLLALHLGLSFAILVSFSVAAHAQDAPKTTETGVPNSPAAEPAAPAAAPDSAARPPAPAAPASAAPAPSPQANPAPPYTVPVAGPPRSGENIGAPTPPGVAPAPGAFPPTPPQFTIETADHVNRLRLGLLWQGQYEAHGASGSEGLTKNLYIRRFSVIIGGRALKYFDYFFDTDFANLFKAPTGDTSVKNGPGIQTKDAFVTFRAIEDQLKFDGGLFLPPGSHNFLQSSGSLYSWDFFLNSYRASTVFGSTTDPNGRDVGAQVRGLVLDGLLEYRAGVFQGKRNLPVAGPPARAAARNPFRFAGRVQLNFLDPEKGFLYGGTYLGTQKVFSIGGFVDYQHGSDTAYRSYGGDAIFDAYNVTAQLDLVYRNGGGVVVLPRQTAFEGEVGYRIAPIQLAPIFRFERRWQAGAASNDETDTGGGLAWFAFGHTANVKAFYTRLIPGGTAKAYDQFNVQAQFLIF